MLLLLPGALGSNRRLYEGLAGRGLAELEGGTRPSPAVKPNERFDPPRPVALICPVAGVGEDTNMTTGVPQPLMALLADDPTPQLSSLGAGNHGDCRCMTCRTYWGPLINFLKGSNVRSSAA